MDNPEDLRHTFPRQEMHRRHQLDASLHYGAHLHPGCPLFGVKISASVP